jgi:hypothetical protein
VSAWSTGSVGMPFGNPGAELAAARTRRRAATYPYDFNAAAERIRASDYPGAEDFTLSNVLRPPSEEQMLRVLEAAELK